MDNKIQIVLNRFDTTKDIKVEDVESTLNPEETENPYKIIGQIPSNGDLALASINEGKPFITSKPDAPISQSIEQLAKVVMGEESEQIVKKKKGFLQSLLGK